jgi:hypothetical protein
MANSAATNTPFSTINPAMIKRRSRASSCSCPVDLDYHRGHSGFDGFDFHVRP